MPADAPRVALLCDAVRTPIGRHGGALASVCADDLAALPIRALVARNPSVDWGAVDEVFLGAANQAGEDNRNVARMALLLAGLPPTVPGVTVNRLCASGLEAVVQGARAVALGEAGLVIAGGSESMTRAPFVTAKALKAWSRSVETFDTTIGWRFVNPRMDEAHGSHPMPETAENVAAEHGVSREDQNAFALRSQHRTARATASGMLTREIVAVQTGIATGGDGTFGTDEHPRADMTLAALAKLRPVARPGGTVTAGNASGVNDGAAAMIIASEAAAVRHGLTPRARVLGAAAAGVAPRVMGTGPVPATRKLLERIGGDIGQFDRIEINEAFAAQVLAALRAFGLPDDAEHVNANGGAIALGHPLGMSGARLVLTLLNQLEQSRVNCALATLCVGVGQGLALGLERV